MTKLMSNILPVNPDDLLYCRGIESERVESKAGWDPKTRFSEPI